MILTLDDDWSMIDNLKIQWAFMSCLCANYLLTFFCCCLSGSIIIRGSFWTRLPCFVTSILLSGLLCVWQMLAFEWQSVAMATKMGPVERRSPVLLVVQAAAWFAVVVLVRVLRVSVSCQVVLQVRWDIVMKPCRSTSPSAKTHRGTHSHICEGQLRDVF